MLVFLDLKTTGNELNEKICALAISSEEESFSELVNEGKKITPEASAYHHITNVHIKEKPNFQESRGFAFLQELGFDDILVVHDHQFIKSLLDESGLSIAAKIIDTKRIAKHLISEIERFDLQYLRYELKISMQEGIIYKPLEDVVVIKSLFEYFLESVSTEQMLDLSFENVLLQKLNFGKYSGRYIEEIVQNDPHYLHWMLSLENLDADLRYSIEYFLER